MRGNIFQRVCGNGVRAFVEYLRTEGLIELEVGETVRKMKSLPVP